MAIDCGKATNRVMLANGERGVIGEPVSLPVLRGTRTDDRDCAALIPLARQGLGRPIDAQAVSSMLAAVRHRHALVAARKVAQQRLHDQLDGLCPGLLSQHCEPFRARDRELRQRGASRNLRPMSSARSPLVVQCP